MNILKRIRRKIIFLQNILRGKLLPFKKLGNNVVIDKGCNFIGCRYIQIENNVAFGAYSVVTAWGGIFRMEKYSHSLLLFILVIIVLLVVGTIFQVSIK